MNKNQSTAMMSVIAILIFACAGFGYSSMTNKARAIKAESELASLKKVIDDGLKKKTASATERRRSATPSSFTDSSFTNIQESEPAPTNRRSNNPAFNRSRASLETLKETNPEAYAAEVERRNNFRKQMQDNSGKQVEFIKKLDTKSMTPEQLDNHNKLLPLVTKNNQILYELTENPEVENASDLRRELFDNSRKMRDLMGTERSIALQQFAKQIGYSADQAVQFEEYVKSVYDMTSTNPFGGAGRGGGNRGQGQTNPQ
jgi:DNA-dependent RNA polymerase auxiliary subunit epsilon